MLPAVNCLPPVRYTDRAHMRVTGIILLLVVAATMGGQAQTKKAPARKAPATRTAPAKKAPPPVALTRTQVELRCPSELGVGVSTKRHFCDVLTGRDPAEGILVPIPPHTGPVTLSFELHNRATYSEDQLQARTAYRKFTATVGILTMDNTLIDRAVIQSEFRTAKDLFDRVSGGAGPGGVKAVAPTGSEFISLLLPADAVDNVSILGEKLSVVRPDGSGTDTFTAPGRPIATISNVMIEFRPAPVKKAPVKKG
jgi:hypothetical protein